MRKTKHSWRSKELVRFAPADPLISMRSTKIIADAKAKAEMAAKAKGSKGPLNTGSQGIKKSGKK